MTRLQARRNIVINHRLLYKGEIRDLDPAVARHYLALYPDALDDLTPKPTVAVSEPIRPVESEPEPVQVAEPESIPAPKPARKRKTQTVVE